MNQHVILKLRMLGRLDVSIDSDRLSIPSPRRRALLAYLAMQPGCGETRERLAALLWGDAPDRNARQSLRQALVGLRQDFAERAESCLTIERETVRLAPAAVSVDALDLLTAATSQNPALIQAAAEQYAGPFLDGLDVAEAGFAEWLEHMRDQIEKAASSVLLQAAQHADSAGAGGRAVAIAERLFRLDVTHEGTHRLLIGLLARHRGREVALARARELIAHLRHELDVDPDPDTVTLVNEIKADRSAAARRQPPASASPKMQSPPAAPAIIQLSGPTPAPRRSRAWMIVVALVTASMPVLGLALWQMRPTSGQAGPLMVAVRAPLSDLQAQGQNPIMVLPMGAEPPTPDLVRTADELTGNLIADLSLIGSLRVISRSTSRLYQGRTFDVAAVGKELGIRYVVDGVVRTVNGHIRADVALIDTSTRLQVWAERFEPSEDRAALDDQITRSIARQLQVSVMLAEDARIRPHASGDTQLDELLTQGWAAIVRMPAEGTSAGAARFFEEALARAPGNVSAKIGYAGSQIVPAVIVRGREQDFDLDRAGRLLTEALQASPKSTTGLLYRGMLDRLHGDIHASLDAFLAAIALNPSFAVAYAQAAYDFYRLGEYDRAMEYVRYAMRLSPRDPGTGVWDEIAGTVEIERGQDAAAFEWLQQATKLLPHNEHCRVALMAVSMLRGDPAAAREHRRELAGFAPWITRETVGRDLGWDTPPHTRPRLITGATQAFALSD